jgi:hypothetical protein
VGRRKLRLLVPPYEGTPMSRRITFEEFLDIRRAIRRRRKRFVEIARKFDISLWTVARIANERCLKRVLQTEPDALVDNGPIDYASKNLRRCPDGGAMIYVGPCLACRMGVAARPARAGDVEAAERLEEFDEDGWEY